MSFFELDGGAKKALAKKAPAKKAPAKRAPAKKAPAKRAPAKRAPAKKAKKGGNFLGTVSELFAPAGWENFVTAAGLLALDRTDNYLRKSKDSKKQRGGEDAMTMEEEMTGGARKRISSRKQRGGSDGHHTVEALDGMDGVDGGEEIEMNSQTGGAMKKGKGRKHRGGAMTEDQQTALYQAYRQSQNPNKNKKNQNVNAYNTFISELLTQLGVEVNPINVEEAKLVIDVSNAKNRLTAFTSSQTLSPDQNSSSGSNFSNGSQFKMNLNTEPSPLGNSSIGNATMSGGKKAKPNPKPRTKAKKSPKKK